jgi:hypothetical protein
VCSRGGQGRKAAGWSHGQAVGLGHRYKVDRRLLRNSDAVGILSAVLASGSACAWSAAGARFFRRGGNLGDAGLCTAFRSGLESLPIASFSASSAAGAPKLANFLQSAFGHLVGSKSLTGIQSRSHAVQCRTSRITLTIIGKVWELYR